MLSDKIAELINKMLSEESGEVIIKRNDFANELGCVPSQITYVLSSRFTPERGYIVESFKGGGGYIKITRKQMSKDMYLMHYFQAVGSSIAENEIYPFLESLVYQGIFTVEESNIALSATSNSALSDISKEYRNIVRASILRHILLSKMTK